MKFFWQLLAFVLLSKSAISQGQTECIGLEKYQSVEPTEIVTIPLPGGSLRYRTAIKDGKGFWYNAVDGRLEYEAAGDGESLYTHTKDYNFNDQDAATSIINCAPSIVGKEQASREGTLIQPTLTGKVIAIDPKTNVQAVYDISSKGEKFGTSAIIQDSDGSIDVISQRGACYHLKLGDDGKSFVQISKPLLNHKLPKKLNQYMRIDVEVPYSPIKLSNGNVVFAVRESRVNLDGEEKIVDSLYIQTPDCNVEKETDLSSPLIAAPKLVSLNGNINNGFMYATDDKNIHVCDSSGGEITSSPFLMPVKTDVNPVVLKDGNFAFAGKDKTVRIFDSKTGKIIGSSDISCAPSADLSAVIEPPSGRQLIVASCKDGNVYYLSGDTAKVVGKYTLNGINHATVLDLGNGINLIPNPNLTLVKVAGGSEKSKVGFVNHPCDSVLSVAPSSGQFSGSGNDH